MNRSAKLATLTLLCLNAGIGFGQDVTESPTSTTRGSAQIELATTYEAFTEAGVTYESYTPISLLALYGISDAVEVRLGWAAQRESSGRDGTGQNFASGLTPLQLGVGADVAQEKGWRPKITLIADAFFPFAADDPFKTETIGGLLLGGFYHTLGKTSALNYNLAMQFSGNKGEYSYLYALTFLQGLNDKNTWGCYAEFNGGFPRGSDDSHFGSLALYFMLTPNIQFDTIVGTGLAAEQDVYFTGRLAIAIPNNRAKGKQ